MDTGETLLWIFTGAIAVGTILASFFACSKSAQRSFVFRDEDASPFK